MEETNKSRNDQGGNKKMFIKMGGGGGGGGGGGIGAVVLLGGALATAAFASAFVLGQKRRSSDEDHRQKSEKEESSKGQEIIPRDQEFYEHEHTRKEKEEVEVEKDSTITISADEVEATKVEDDPISDDGFVIVKEEISSWAEDEKIESLKEEISDHHSKQKTNLEQVISTEDKSAERESDGEIDTKEEEENSEACHDGGDIEVIRADINGVEGDENVNIEEKNEIGNGEMNEEKCVEPERAMVDLIVDEIVFSEKTLLPTDSVTEKTAIYGCMVHAKVTKHVEEEKTSMQFDAKQNVEEDQISPEEVEVVKYVANEAAPQNLGSEEEVIVHENGEVSRKDGDDEESNEVIETKGVKIIMDYGGGDRSTDQNEKGGLCSEEKSKWKQAKGMSYEVGGKIQEDYSATFINKEEVVMRKDHPTRWRGMIWTLSVLSTLSCSWFFDLSPAKLCLVVFLTVFMLEIYDYPLLNRKQAQCLQAAKGERIYEQRSLK